MFDDGLPRENGAMIQSPRLRRWSKAWPLMLLAVLVVAALASDPVHGLLLDLVQWAERSIRDHPVAGPVAFVAAAAISAMLAFFSSAALVPAAAYAWGPWTAVALLWLGWLLGGVAAYGVGRALGRPLFAGAGPQSRIARLRTALPERITVSTALLVQLALPSEVPGYLFGILRVRLRVYLAAAALGELPYAAAAVAFSEGLIDRQLSWLLVAGSVMALITLAALVLLRRRMRGTAPD